MSILGPNKNRFYIQNGKLLPLVDEIPAEIIIANKNELDLLGTNFPIGSLARNFKTGQVFIFDPSFTWVEKERGGASQGSSISRSSDDTHVVSLSNDITITGSVIDVIGIPPYISNVSEYSEYGIEDTGWYIFCRVFARDYVEVTETTAITDADGYIANEGDDHVDIAVRFNASALIRGVTIDWGPYQETLYFRASDLAIRNLDYRTTFYIYDIAPYATWEYALTTDTEFVADKAYFTKDGDTYTEVTVTAGDAVPANTYYNHSLLHFEGMVPNVTYRLNEIVDCPIEIALPNIPDDGHGAWFEIQLRYDGSYSCTLLPPLGVLIGTAQTQAQTKGMNTIDLQYTHVHGCQVWTLLNTHSNFTPMK